MVVLSLSPQSRASLAVDHKLTDVQQVFEAVRRLLVQASLAMKDRYVIIIYMYHTYN